MRVVERAYAGAALTAATVFTAGAALLAVTLPYHVWDAFSLGDWSRRIAAGSWLDPINAGQLAAARPLFFYLQGAVWSVTGLSFTAGRLLSLAFALLFLVLVVGCARRLGAPRPVAGIAALVALAVPALSAEAVAGDTDVPAAAMTALVAWLALGRRSGYRPAAALAAAAVAALLTKPTTVAPLCGLAIWMAIDDSRPLRDRIRWSLAPLALGGAVGVGYYAVMAARFHTWLLPFLRTTTSEGLWAQRAAAARADAVLSLDVLGGALRLALAYALVYSVARAVGARHRRAGLLALPASAVWAVAGPIAAGESAISSAWQAFALVGFAAVAVASALGDPGDAPGRATLLGLLAFGGLPLAVWIYTTAYADRLAATSWPGLVLLITVALVPGVRALAQLSLGFGLVPVTAFAAAAWLAVAGLDGLHGHQWIEYRSLGLHGVWNKDRTLNIVLPQVQEALAAVEPELGARGRLSVWDPRFAYFLPGRVDTTEALHCSDVRRDAVLLVLTSDEAVAAARDAAGLATPEDWSKCRSPRLVPLPAQVDGFAAFRVVS